MDLPFARIPLSRGRTVSLWCGDAVEGLDQRVRTGGADVVVTSPPYNLGVRYRSYADARPRAEYLAWVGTVRDAVDRALAPAGSFFLNVGGPPKDPWLPWDVAREVGRTFVLQNVLHWVKSIAIDRAFAGRAAGLDRDLALGHYKPLGSVRYVHGAHEYVFHFSRRGDVPIDRLAIGVAYQDSSNVHRWGRSPRELRCRGNTWFLPYSTIRVGVRDRPHPATFPPELPEWCLRLHGVGRIRLAVDPFVGIGSSAVAAARCGVEFVGFDLDPEYLRVAAERVRKERSTPAPKRRRRPVPAAKRAR
jgi:site-specific DNA-methyltransferase (adenine-specific)